VIGLDTNVLVRFFTRDDEAQFFRARFLIRSLTSDEPGFIPLVTLAEMVWVLERSYRTAKPVIVKIVESLLQMPGLVLEKAETVEKALRVFRTSSADFSDALIEWAAHDAGCVYTVTFDEKAAGDAGMRLVP
jgi:predicted nucleic-acid-binding protein